MFWVTDILRVNRKYFKWIENYDDRYSYERWILRVVQVVVSCKGEVVAVLDIDHTFILGEMDAPYPLIQGN